MTCSMLSRKAVPEQMPFASLSQNLRPWVLWVLHDFGAVGSDMTTSGVSMPSQFR